MRDGDHVGEDAELYALGALANLERARIERHLVTCDECSKRVGEAESTVLAFIEDDARGAASPHARPPAFARRRPAWAAAVAAAIVAGFFAWGLTTMHERSAHETEVAQTSAISAMLSGHFAHVAFAARAPGAPAAKAIYAREGGWIYVIAAPGTDALAIAVSRHGRQRPAGTLPGSGDVRSSFIILPGRVDAIALLDGGVTIATAHLVYPAQR